MKWLKALLNLFKKPTVTSVKVPRGEPNVIPFQKGSKGIDISHHNKVLDMNEVVKHVDFIYMKATEGVNFLSNVFVERAKILNDLRFPWGAYHYYRTDLDPIRQADHFLQYIDVKSGLPPVLDVESINNRYKSHIHTPHILQILERIEEATGITPILYTNYYFSKDFIKPDNRFLKYPLWLAWYRKDFAGVKIPAPWSKVKLWQFTSSGRINGIEGRVDVNEVMS